MRKLKSKNFNDADYIVFPDDKAIPHVNTTRLSIMQKNKKNDEFVKSVASGLVSKS